MKTLVAACICLVAMTTVNAHLFGGPHMFGRFPGMLHPGLGFNRLGYGFGAFNPILNPGFGAFGHPGMYGPHVGYGYGAHAEPGFGAHAEPGFGAHAEPGVGVAEPLGAVPEYYKK